MTLTQFTITTLATLFAGGVLVAQQPSPGDTQRTKPPAVQGQADRGQADRGQADRGQADRGQADRGQADRGQTGRDQTGRDQTGRDRAAREGSGQRTPGGNSQSKDQILAKSLAITNQEQVLISRFAQENAINDDVKAFAATLEEDHLACLEELKTFASKAGTNSGAASEGARSAAGSEGARGQGERSEGARGQGARGEGARSEGTFGQGARGEGARSEGARSEGARSAGSDTSNIDFLQLHQEISEQCLTDSKEMLSAKEGIEFDKCFVGMQVAKHAAMQSSLTVLQRHASGELQDMIKESLAKNAEHLEAAVNLMEQLANDESSSTSEKSE